LVVADAASVGSDAASVLFLVTRFSSVLSSPMRMGCANDITEAMDSKPSNFRFTVIILVIKGMSGEPRKAVKASDYTRATCFKIKSKPRTVGLFPIEINLLEAGQS